MKILKINSKNKNSNWLDARHCIGPSGNNQPSSLLPCLSPEAQHIVEIQFSFRIFERSLIGNYSIDNGYQSSRNSVEVLMMTDGYWGPWEEWQTCSKTCVQELENPGLR